MRARSLLLLAASVLLPACGLIVGIKPLDADEVDSGGAPAMEDADIVPIPEAGPPRDATDEKKDAGPPPDTGCVVKTTEAKMPEIVDVKGGGIAWGQKDAVKFEDNVPAKGNGCCAIGTDDTQVLTVQGFGFRIPDTAKVRGVKVEMKVKQAGAMKTMRDRSVTLLPTAGKDLKADAPYADAYETRVYGGPDELWGLALTPAIVNGAAFGVALQMTHPPFNNADAEVDVLRVSVTYCE